MPLSPDLFRSVTPPGLWITLGQLEQPESDSITVAIRIKEGTQRSVSAQAPVSRYCPTDQLLFAVAQAVKHLTGAQETVDRALLLQVLRDYLNEYVDPF
jgi:hypothetical protein